MSKKIEKKIVSYKVTTEEEAQQAAVKEAESNIIQMHEKVSRPEAWQAAPTRSRRRCLIMPCI